MERQSIDVYVRLTANEDADARQLSFQIPQGISQAELLERDWAIDGRSALTVVGLDELLPEQRDLITWLSEKGYEVNFT